MLVPSTLRQQFDELGYAIVPDALSLDQLQMLREECAYFVGYIDASMKARNRKVYGITHLGKRYFIANRYRQSRRLPDFLYCRLMADITTALLGDSVFLFNEQWVVKGPEQGMKFAWHQDSGYVKFRDPGNAHTPYVTCWVALDDMTAENGTIYVLPHDRAGTRDQVLHHRVEDGTNDLVGYEGDDPGELIEVSAGTVVVFSSTSLHRSTANTTANPRRVYLAQYSADVINHSNGSLWAQAVPFVEDGRIVYDREQDMAKSGLT